jgi:hypothetical protein
MRVEVPEMDIRVVTFILDGDSPLLTARVPPWVLVDIERRQAGLAPLPREKRSPEEAYQEALYISKEGWYGFPARAFHKASISAMRHDKMKMTNATTLFQPLHVGVERETGHPLVRIEGGIPERYSVQGFNKQARALIMTHRGMFWPWSVELGIRYNAAVVTQERIAYMINMAGFHVGVGGWRPENKGPFGMFHIRREEEEIL